MWGTDGEGQPTGGVFSSEGDGMSDRIADLERALHIIHTWATFFVDSPDDRQRILHDIIRKCDEVLFYESDEVTE